MRSLRSLLRLVDTGRSWVKLSRRRKRRRPARRKYEDVGRLAKALVKHAPERMLWRALAASLARKPRPPEDADLLDLLLDWAPDAAARRKISPTTRRSFMAFRVGRIGLGMAVTPHAKSLADLRDRVEVAYAL